MRRILSAVTVAATAAITCPASAQDPSAQDRAESPLPLERVRLYETGVGYFERSGTMRGDSVTLPVPSGHLDDALKTLVILSAEGGATVSGITFASSVSSDMGKALAGLPPDDADIGYGELLESLEGAPVEIVTAKERLTGRLIDVEAAPAEGRKRCETRLEAGQEVSACVTEHDAMILLLGSDGSLRRVPTDAVKSVRPTDDGWSKRVGSALDALSDGANKRTRAVSVVGEGGPVRLGYIAEAPVWRTTYRLVLADDEAPAALQGWALLHNDSDEDWKNVRIELVNGRPDSFLFPLAAPRYAHRELVTPDNPLSTVPQLLGQSPDEMWSGFGAGGLGLTGVGEGGGGHGYGIGLGSVGTIGHGAGTGRSDGESSLVEVGNLAALAGAEGTESGALFRYALPPIDLANHSSALLPFVDAKIAVRRLAYFSNPGAVARTAVDLDNDTGQTFPAGVISVFSDGGFAGETSLSRTKPGERRILQFGTDLDVELEKTAHAADDEPRVVLRTVDGLELHFVRHHRVTYGLDNKSGAGRRVTFPLEFVHNADVKGADDLIYDAESQQVLAVFEMPPKSRLRKEITVREGRQRQITVVDAEVLGELVAAAALPQGQRTLLQRAKKHLEKAKSLTERRSRQLAKLRKERARISRLRASVRALGAREEGAPLAARLLAAEKRIVALETAIDNLELARLREEKSADEALDALGRHAPG